MEVEAEEQPKVHHRKMGPKGSKHQQDVQDEAMVDVFVDNGRCLNLLERRAYIPLSIQRMMASGPINGLEIAYYPWNLGKRNEARPKEQEKAVKEQEKAVRGRSHEQRKSQEQRARKEQNQMQERKGSEAAGIVNL
ncbi:unnamed protein product [Cylicocyclus nassatus]|uniref:Uncharacterized protein n=1 Tax=Cylicocyclus nassatus TaxID=53992 RepID=A0AA36GJ78_CYLNA|nr:unnamed protein product [Cylicocyclus nassatus]